MMQCSPFEKAIQQRSENTCELCGATTDLSVFDVVPVHEASADNGIFACAICQEQISSHELDEKHWNCLRDAMWSEVSAVQILAYRLLKRLSHTHWASDLLSQMYLDDEMLAWAEKGEEAKGNDIVTLDSNGAVLSDGDSVTLIKDLDVKGAGFVAKRGTMVKNIRLIDDPENIEGRVNKITLVLKTKFLKRV